MVVMKMAHMKHIPETCDVCVYYGCRPHPYKGWTDSCELCMQCLDDDQEDDWMMLIALIASVIMGAYFIGIAKILLMVLSSFLASAWIGVAIVLINSDDYKKRTDNEEEEVSE